MSHPCKLNLVWSLYKTRYLDHIDRLRFGRNAASAIRDWQDYADRTLRYKSASCPSVVKHKLPGISRRELEFVTAWRVKTLPKGAKKKKKHLTLQRKLNCTYYAHLPFLLTPSA